MLILTRRISEKFLVGKEVTITVLEVEGQQAKFAIDAPRTISVDRQEVRERKNIEKAREQGSGLFRSRQKR